MPPPSKWMIPVRVWILILKDRKYKRRESNTHRYVEQTSLYAFYI